MKQAVIIIAKQGFRDEEYKNPKEVLTNNGIKVITASTETGQAIGKLGMETNVDINLQSLNVAEYDAVIFVGGPGSYNLFDNQEAHKIVKEALEKNKVLGAICAAVGILATAGILKNKKVTSFSGVADLIKSKGAIYTGRGVEKDGNIITADGPQSATLFGEKILRKISTF
ncbi:hypothetical protein A2526_06015 [candidate division WOR-1 bacterium RIFOXYD2_FULL_36_8]|uniref:DJ-1/PfpI domain-containing protein n=1 Tax=candidate division WOR-1 bacterium RIFOXYB2_FULL_36_35 TaxID=1802578 RepID=A0A1F4S7Q2_UNCSA|nr:MAG: hypothetical protein A2230_05010 [candidate division WOR-1 bacterium RIFOXYA2_FULL_36_21]OGC15763.1 MAG: hypothetical protein A2290_05435 [candidate division WOR-1 bacterium RIFOXYB2_FULL_36_35]OGC21118.1 MAG: hypothetical protein A2282_03765 [candidate division WOR-1 bacterium RIFOXYA12_FULL_36_13]OGC39029.1 MAG: hypothetical protein A2526_06015 [candidate division WOR-1 bacterium RIFOXYD2_FULL_36_8]